MSGYIGVPVGGVSADSTIYLPVRQTVLIGSATAAGVPNFMAAGTGLRVSLSAAATPMAIAFASGFGTYGAQDYVTRLTANNSDMTAADLGAANTNYILATYVNNASVTWNSTLVPPQYGPTFNQFGQSLLRFAGADASTTVLDDYGPTWTVTGNAQIDTAVQIDGLNTLLLDGTGDQITAGFLTLGGGSWTIEFKVRWNTLPAASTQTMLTAVNGTGFGVTLSLNDAAGTKRFSLALSSNGTSQDLINTTGTTHTVWATATTYHVAVTYDALAGKYFIYRDGVADAGLTTTTASRICATTKIRLGDSEAGGNGHNGCMAGFRFSPCCRYPNGTTFTAPTISTFAVEGHWFDNVGYQMLEATTASSSAGTNPTFTQRNRVFVGEADTSAAAVTAVRNYAYQGRYISADTTIPASGTRTAFSANLGVIPTVEPIVVLRNYTADAGHTPGMIVRCMQATGASLIQNTQVNIEDRNTLSVTTGGTNAIQATNRTTGVSVAAIGASWKMIVEANRGW